MLSGIRYGFRLQFIEGNGAVKWYNLAAKHRPQWAYSNKVLNSKRSIHQYNGGINTLREWLILWFLVLTLYMHAAVIKIVSTPGLSAIKFQVGRVFT